MLARRLIFGILWVLSVVGISFYGGPISYGFFLMLTFIPIASLMYLLFVLVTYRIYQEIGTKNLTAGRKVPYYITLQNETLLLFASVRLTFYSSFSVIEGLHPDTEYELLPRSGMKLETNLICKYRGEYEVGIKQITLTDYLGLFRFTFRNPEPLRVIVRPALIRPESIGESFFTRDFHQDSVAEQTHPDYVVRDYTAGDPMRLINWKATARTGSPMVRNLVGEQRRGILIVADTCRHYGEDKQFIPAEDRVLTLVLALSGFYVSRGVPVTLLVIQKDTILYETVENENGMWKYYETVSMLSFDDRHTSKAFAALLAGKAIAGGALGAALVSGTPEENMPELQQYFEKSGIPTGLYIADPSQRTEECL